jgi:hypothetical protein
MLAMSAKSVAGRTSIVIPITLAPPTVRRQQAVIDSQLDPAAPQHSGTTRTHIGVQSRASVEPLGASQAE